MTLYPVADTNIRFYNAENNYGASGSLPLRPDNLTVPLVRFDLSSISEKARVDSALLRLWPWKVEASGGQTVGAYQALRHWEELEATWNVAETGVNWGTAGCNNTTTDREAAAGDTTFIGPGTTWWAEWDIAAMAGEWVADSNTNQGLMLRAEGSTSMLIYFYSRERDPSTAPYLEIEYYLTDAPSTPTVTPTPTATSTPAMSIGLTPPAITDNTDPVNYTLVVGNTSGRPVVGDVSFQPDDDTPYNDASPAPDWGSPFVGWVAWLNQSVATGQTLSYRVSLDGPDASGTYTQSAMFLDPLTGWSISTHHSAVYTVTTPTSTPTSTPTVTPTTAATATPTPTVTPTWTPQPTPVAAVVLNELCPVPDTDWTRNGISNALDEYLELREAHGAAQDISGWKIRVTNYVTNRRTTYLIPFQTIIAAGDYLAIFGAQYLRTDTEYRWRERFALPDNAACVELLNASDVVQDGVCYDVVGAGGWGGVMDLGTGDSWGRYPDLSSSWQHVNGSPTWGNFVATPTPTATP